MQGLWFLPSLIFGLVQGFVSGNWQMFWFSVLSLLIWPVSRWIKRNRDFPLDQPVSFDGKNIWIGENRLPHREIFWRREWHQVVWDGLFSEENSKFWSEMLEQSRFRGFVGQQPKTLWLGIADDQNFDFDLVVDGPHMLIVGATGTGKSELLRLLLSGWLNQTEAMELTLIDFKGGATMSKFAEHPRVIGLATDLETTDVLAVAETLAQQLGKRQAMLAEAGASSIEELQRLGGSLCRQAIVIDELGELLRQHPRIVQVLEQIASRGRSLGMHLVVANQSMAGISRTLLVNLRARVAIGEMDPIDLSQLGFRNRLHPQLGMARWRSARLRTGNGFELSFNFPVGF